MKIKSFFAMTVLSVCMLGAVGCGDKNIEKQIKSADKAVMEENYEEALEIYENALKKTDEGEQKKAIQTGLGVAKMGIGDYEGAIVHFEKALKLSNGSVGAEEYNVSYYLAAAYEKLGQTPDAIEVYSNILDLKDDKEAYFQRGTLYLTIEDTKKAEKDFDKCIKEDKNNFSLYVEVFEQWENNGLEGGEKYLQQLLDKKAKSGEEIYYRGVAYEKLGESNAAEEAFRQALDKGYSDANLALGQLYTEPGSEDAALACFEAYLEDNRESGLAYAELADFQMESGNYKAALATVQEGLGLKDTESKKELLQCEVACYEYLQDFKTARNKALEYMEAYPYDEQMQKELEFLNTR